MIMLTVIRRNRPDGNGPPPCMMRSHHARRCRSAGERRPRVQAPPPERLRRHLHRLRRLLPGAQQPRARDSRHPPRAPAVLEGRSRMGADRHLDFVRDLEVPDGVGVGSQQPEIFPAARPAAVVHPDGGLRRVQGDLRLAGAGDRHPDRQRLGPGHGLAAVRQDDGALVQHQGARARRLVLERRAQRRRRPGRDLRRARRDALPRLGREVLLQRRDRRRGRRRRLLPDARHAEGLRPAAGRGIQERLPAALRHRRGAHVHLPRRSSSSTC